MKLCLGCRTFVTEKGAKRCPACGGAVVHDTPESRARLVESMVDARVQELVESWRDLEVVDARSARRIKKWLAERHAPAVEETVAETVAELVVAEPAVVERAARDGHADAGHAGATAAEVFHAGEVTHGALDALASLDAPETPEGPSRWETEVRPLLYENVGWFIGTLFVLAGSVYGVREAWRSLGGVARHLVVATAFMAYHAGFVGIARLLAPRSAATGRVLGSIALGLLPVVFVALSSLASFDRAAGLGASVACSLLAALTLRSVGARFEREASEGATAAAGPLALAVLPALAAEVPMASFASTSWWRVVASLAGVACIALVGRADLARAPASPGARPALHRVVAALYAAVALLVVGMAGASDGGSDLARLSTGFTFAAASLACVIASLAALPGARAAWPRGASVVEVLALGALPVATASAVSVAWQRTSPLDGAAATATALLAAASFARAASLHAGALHFVVPAATVAAWTFARVLLPASPPWWPALAMAAPAAGMFAARWLDDEASARARKILARWGVALGAALVVKSCVIEATAAPPGEPWVAASVTAAAFALAAHLAGGWRRRALHVAGALSATVAVACHLLPPARDGRLPWVAVLASVGAAYGALAVPYEALAARWKRASNFEVLDDVSRVALTVAAVVACASLSPAAAFVLPSRVWDAAGRDQGALVAAVGVALLVRALRDRSRVPGVLGAVTLGFAATYAAGASTAAQSALVVSALALASAALATLASFAKARDGGEGVAPRRLFGAVPVPVEGRGVVLLRDVFADATVLAVLAAGWSVARWIPAWDAATRPWTLAGGAMLVAACVVAFASPGFVARRLRGATAALFAAGAAVALAAVANRVGLPLPPDVVGWKLTAVAAGVWLVRQASVRWGDALARRLGNPSQGAGYRSVFSTGVVALAAVLVVDAGLVAVPDGDRALLATPPMLLLGAAFALALMARGTRLPGWLAVSVGVALPGAALAFAQGGAMRVHLVAVLAPTTRWVPANTPAVDAPTRWGDPLALMQTPESLDAVRARAVLGVAAVALAYAAVAALYARREGLARRATSWLLGGSDGGSVAFLRATAVAGASAAASVVVAAAWWRGNLAGAALLALAGAALLVARARRAGALVTTAGVTGAVHALALRSPAVPAWAGVAMMAVAAAIAHAGPAIVRRYDADAERVYARTHALALLVASAALVYALAAGASLTGGAVGVDLLWGAAASVTGRWTLSPALPTALALGAWALGAAAAQWQSCDDREGAARGYAASAVTLLALAAWSGVTVAAVLATTREEGPWTLAIARGYAAFRAVGLTLVLASAAVAAAAHGLRRASLRGGRGAVAEGLGWGRDAQLAATVLWAALFATLARQRGWALAPEALTAGVGGFALAVAVAGHAAWAEGTPRHVYFIQTAIVAVYGLARAVVLQRLPPEADAVFGLAMGFLLVGVTVQARRAGIPPVAVATRRFAALLPFGVALALPQEATASAALAAAGAAVLYGALGYVERSRLLGSLGAASANVALLVFALSKGLTGVEVWLAPAGLFVLLTSQILASTLDRNARAALRVVGSLLMYLPAAVQIAFQVGNARDGAYPVAFGLACLAGVAAGMLLHIRAYLALGTGFLVLDVAANLVHAGLRDHRVGFVLLSGAGLGILGAMVFLTLRRDAVRAWRARWRARLRSWE